jgi:phospholipid transport system substrate-binding protein
MNNHTARLSLLTRYKPLALGMLICLVGVALPITGVYAEETGQPASQSTAESDNGNKRVLPGETSLPNVMVETAIVRMFDAVKAENEQNGEISVERVRELVEDIVMPIIDEQMMSQWVLGRNWTQMTPAQRKEFIHLFKDLLIRTYASALSDYVYFKTQFFPFKHDANAKKVTVRMEIARTDGSAIPFQFRLRNSRDGWKVYDALVDGISLVQNYRTTFADMIRSSGVEGMLKRLREEQSTPSQAQSES